MLILSRKANESIVIDGRIVVKIVRVDGEVVKVGIEAPKNVPIHRLEVYTEIQQANEQAIMNLKPGSATAPKLPRVNFPKQQPAPGAAAPASKPESES